MKIHVWASCLSTLFSYLFILALGRVETDKCKPTRCSKHGPTIKFPFRDKHLHPEYCGYPGFDVFCNEKKETVLVLPVSVQVVVEYIDYVHQQVQLHDPEQCLVNKLPHLNLSTSQFHFLKKYYLHNFTLFNCSGSKRYIRYPIPCLDGSRYHSYAVDSEEDMNYDPLTSCTKIHEIPNVPRRVFMKNALHLEWYEPACGSCEGASKGSLLAGGLATLAMQKSQLAISGHQRIGKITKNPLDTFPAKLADKFVALSSCLAVTILASLVLLGISIIAEKHNHMKIEKFLEDQRALKPTRFTYSDLRRITLKFSEKLGEGGYGIVYKGKLSNEINVAVKVLHNSKGNGEDFVNEVSTIGRIHHVNVVRLVGFCADGFRRALVYEFLPNDSLENFIFQSSGSKKKPQSWQILRDIALGISKGIEYLHEGCDQQILHLDIKPHNILLDQNFNPKICDFGMAKLCAKEQSGVTMTAARGTMGYIAPEVLLRSLGRVSHKSDVYSFGMLLLEMVGVRKNIEPNVNYGQEFWGQIEGGEDGNIARRLTIVGLWCIQWCPSDRPSMKDVLQMWEADDESLTIPPNPLPANNTNAINPNAGTVPGRRHYEIAELALIQKSESEYLSC
ncbi:hypothetical protein CASFOL_010845 [Castilleja foliolosa]|uniref:non-specific serine/threonine protein kinase n=1 Tax=Castilleja foliolosa TaxID=1961234 RepID=A0ABD3DTU3_9LAMI